MGKLRKIGKKLKKGIGKLMGSKLGKIVGMIGLAMSMGSLAGAFIGGTKQVAGEAALKEVGKEAIKETGKEAIKETGKEAIKEITVDAVKRDSLEVLGDAALSSSEAATAVLDSAENMVKDGLGTTNINNSLTDSVNQLQTDLIDYEKIGKEVGGIGDTRTLLADASGSVNTPPSDFYSFNADSLKSNEFASDFKISEAGDLSVGVKNRAIKPEYISPSTAPTSASFEGLTAPVMEAQNINPNSLLVDTASSINQIQPPNAVAGNQTFLQQIGTSVKDLPKNTVEYVKNLPENTKEFFKQDAAEIVGDMAVSGVKTSLLNAVVGEPDEVVYSKGVSTRLESVAPQAAYMDAITPSYLQNFKVKEVPTFADLQKQIVYGTASPSFLGSIELPQINVGIPS